MRKFYALVKLNLKAMLSSFRFGGGKKRRRAASGLGALIFPIIAAPLIRFCHNDFLLGKGKQPV